MFVLLLVAVAFGCGASAPLIDYCPMCVEFTQQFINQLLDIIASKSINSFHPPSYFQFEPAYDFIAIFFVIDGGVIGGCADLCGKLVNKTHSEAAAIACNALCDLVGIRTFIAMVNKYVHALPPLLPSISLIFSVCLLYTQFPLSLSDYNITELTWIQFTTVNFSMYAQ